MLLRFVRIQTLSEHFACCVIDYYYYCGLNETFERVFCKRTDEVIAVIINANSPR